MMNDVNNKMEEYPMGSRVAIRNLVKVPELNGCIGIVKSRLVPPGVDGRQAIILLDAQQHQQQQHHQQQHGRGHQKVVSIKPVNLQFEPRPVKSLSEKEMKLVLEQKGVDVSNMPAGFSKQADLLRPKVTSAVSDGMANINNHCDDDIIAIEIGRILGLDAAEKDAMKELESEREGEKVPAWVNVDKVYNAKLLQVISSQKDPPCLGGVPVEGVKIPMDTIYAGGLARPSNLGPLKSNVPFRNDEAKRLFRQLSEGDCFIRWGINQEEDALAIWVCEDDSNKDPKIFRTITQQYNVVGGKYGPIIGGKLLCDELINHEGQIHALRLRVLHRFFRDHGHLLPAKQQNNVYIILEQLYAHEGQQWKLVLDASIVAADAALNSGHPDCVRALVRVGQALEASGQFAKASLIYKDTGKLYSKGAISNNCEYVCKMSMIHKFAATALVHCAKFSAAEDECFLALQADYHEQSSRGGLGGSSTNWDVNQEFTTKLWQSMLIIHDSVAAEVAAAGTIVHVDTQVLQLTLIALPGLLSTAGYSPLEEKITHSYEYHATLFKRLARERFKKSRQVAVDALAKAVKESSSSKDFRVKLSKTLNPRLLEAGYDVSVSSSISGHEKELLKEAKHAARGTFLSHQRASANYTGSECHNPGCNKWEKLNFEEVKSKSTHCPCQGVQYCSRVCQKEHWPIHKKTYSHAKAKK